MTVLDKRKVLWMDDESSTVRPSLASATALSGVDLTVVSSFEAAMEELAKFRNRQVFYDCALFDLLIVWDNYSADAGSLPGLLLAKEALAVGLSDVALFTVVDESFVVQLLESVVGEGASRRVRYFSKLRRLAGDGSSLESFLCQPATCER